jgi:two-component system phosphate regulon sensor histidine kinase PhoR
VPSETWPLIAVVAVAVALVASLVALMRGRELGRLSAGNNGNRAAPPAVDKPGYFREELLRLADAAEIGLLRVGEHGRIELANETAHGLLARSDGGLLGLSPIGAFVDHRIDELLRQAASLGSPQLELEARADPQRTLLIRARRDEGGTWLIIRDLTELRRLQRIRAEFIDNLSHELRTPLTTVRLLTETLATELERTEVLPPRIRDAIVKIDVESGHLVQMVNELLDLARIEGGEAPLRTDEVDLGTVIDSALERLRLYAERQDVRLHAELPAEAQERTIVGDEERLEQLLINLIHNAVKFSPSDGEVAIRLGPREDEVLIEVEDHGVGIPRADIERIFERFYKVDRARVRGAGGTGLGLAIARHIAERHGGRIWASSEEGTGSTLSVLLPRGPAMHSPIDL